MGQRQYTRVVAPQEKVWQKCGAIEVAHAFSPRARA
jgi:hypothetical protein